MAVLGYMRVSTKGQKFDLQADALARYGVEERCIYRDIASGAKQARPDLAACLKALQPGDTLVVWKVDRLARSLLHLLEILQEFRQRTIVLCVLEGEFAQLRFDTSTGMLLFTVLGAFAEFERTLLRERITAGLEAARERGHRGGRRPRLNGTQCREVQLLHRGGMPITEIAAKFQCTRNTIYKALQAAHGARADDHVDEERLESRGPYAPISGRS